MDSVAASQSMAMDEKVFRQQLAHTYSIVARDKETGEMGVAVQSHWFSVGTVVAWGKAGVGVVATQSFVNPAFGPEGLRMLEKGKAPEAAVRLMVKSDKGRDLRQLAVLGKLGAFAYTGKRCIPEAGHIIGNDFSVQANMMLNSKIWSSMARSFERSKGPLAERLVRALEAGERAGGDIRGKQSAALVVVKGVSTGKEWEGRSIDLRIDDHNDPVKELRRLLTIHRSYEHMNAGDQAMEAGNVRDAFSHYSVAHKMQPNNNEMLFWTAVGMANNGSYRESLPLFRKVFKNNENWMVLAERLLPLEMLRITEEQMENLRALMQSTTGKRSER